MDKLINDLDNFSVSVSKSCDVEESKVYLSDFNPANSITILNQNIRSIHKNIDSLKVLIHRLEVDCDIIVLTECWLINHDHNLPLLPDYNIFFNKVISLSERWCHNIRQEFNEYNY